MWYPFCRRKRMEEPIIKNKQIKLAALTVAVAAGVMVQPVKARAEEAPETEAASETESTSAQEQ